MGAATRSTDGGTGSTGPGAVWTDSDAAATGWTGVVFASTGEMAPGRSVRASPQSPLPASAAQIQRGARRPGHALGVGGVLAAAAGAIGDIASRDSVAAGALERGPLRAARTLTLRRRRTLAAGYRQVAAATGDAARRICPPAG